jgi:hypothetical protein
VPPPFTGRASQTLSRPAFQGSEKGVLEPQFIADSSLPVKVHTGRERSGRFLTVPPDAPRLSLLSRKRFRAYPARREKQGILSGSPAPLPEKEADSGYPAGLIDGDDYITRRDAEHLHWSVEVTITDREIIDVTFLLPPTLAPSVLAEQTALPSHLENLVFAADLIIETCRVRSRAGAAGCLRIVRSTARSLSAGGASRWLIPVGFHP